MDTVVLQKGIATGAAIAGTVVATAGAVVLSPDVAADVMSTVNIVGTNAAGIGSAIGLLITVATAIWHLWQSRIQGRLDSAAAVKGVHVEVGPGAPMPAILAAADDSRPDIKFARVAPAMPAPLA